ncbi:hypothetical protein [Glaciimonas immobilis]|uniref:Uncharacterized protein n=1 Tax=Glaciimonas immobilis TaxID=728004 RepID=A0A840RUS3_9BURK|nr:hypothetical protein [Glaciimonas immobilis]KAF3997349.1 hypothetical protein HAV38_12555 [Glaciimonas immobilis]MBB5200818.1 hypothetical protein [Glaciimonas immobilis]
MSAATGGSAFLVEKMLLHSTDMTIRDYFAAKALATFNPDSSPSYIAARSCVIADAMLKERAK